MKKSNELSKREDGRLVRCLRDPKTGKRIYFYGKTVREINKKILDYTERLENGKTFAEVAAEWWEDVVQNIEVQTMRTYDTAMRKAIKYFGDTPIKEIKSKDIMNYVQTYVRLKYADKTIHNRVLVCNLIFKYAIVNEDLEYNPCAGIQLKTKAQKTKRTAASSRDEEIIKKTADIWLFPYFALYTGMRLGEILALQWQDIDFENNTISVTKSVFHYNNKPIVKSPKTEAGNRIVPLLASLKEKLLNVPNQYPNNYVFSDTGLSPLTHKRYRVLYDKYKTATGITATAHQLRHSFATIAFECGVPVKSVQEILGHKQVSTTMDIYTDFRKKSFDEAADLLNAKL